MEDRVPVTKEDFLEPTHKFIITKRWGVTKLFKDADGFYRDVHGTVYAMKDTPVLDAADVCGIWPFDIPNWDYFLEVNQACAPHDFAYASLVYQAFHKRSEADAMLNALQTIIGHPVLGESFEQISRVLGCGAWENPATND